MNRRIWELDAFRGICILGMVIVHLLYDLEQLLTLQLPRAYRLALDWGGVLFLLLCGISVTLGRHHIRRGLCVLLGGMLCTAATAVVHLLGFAGEGILIRFGALHCLGCCMLLWSLLRRFPTGLFVALGLAAAAIGLYWQRNPVFGPALLLPLGIVYPGFSSGDYFPLLPNLGYFLLGAALGRRLYSQKTTLFPGIDPRRQPLRFLCACGRHTLPVYLLHQPIITLLLALLPMAS